MFKVVNADSTKVLKDLALDSLFGDTGRKSPRWALTFLDPPFNIGHGYKGFNDKQPADVFAKWLRGLVTDAWVATSGVMCLHGPDYMVDHYMAAMQHVPHHRVAWIIWHYRFGQCTRHNWVNAHCHCLVYAKDPDKFTFNADAVLVPSDRATVYNDPRIHDSPRGGMRLPGTVWGIPSDGPNWGRVQGNSRERRAGHPNQLPEVYMTRLIKAYTNPGDYVLDPFCGSGTTATVAHALGRNCMTVDISAESAASARVRIAGGMVRIANNTEPTS